MEEGETHIPAPSRAVDSAVLVGGEEEGEAVGVKRDQVAGSNFIGLEEGHPFSLENVW